MLQAASVNTAISNSRWRWH